MKYFVDQEFSEGFHKPLFGRNRHYIDLISIGIVSEDNRTFYAICKEFDIKKAWNAWQQRTGQGDRNNIEPRQYWLRENVLRPIWEELEYKEYREDPNEIKQEFYDILDRLPENERVPFYVKELLPLSIQCRFGYHEFKRLVKKYGKTRSQIANEIISFIRPYELTYYSPEEFQTVLKPLHNIRRGKNDIVPCPVFIGYYCDYDWVLFCSLFGKMIELPEGFPMFCIDLKQMLDEALNDAEKMGRLEEKLSGQFEIVLNLFEMPFEDRIAYIKQYANYPKQTNEHNALGDAIFCKRLDCFISSL